MHSFFPVAERGDVDYLHFSPPCQALSNINAHKGLDRFEAQLAPLLEQVRPVRRVTFRTSAKAVSSWCATSMACPPAPCPAVSVLAC